MPGARLHFDGEVAGGKIPGRRQAIAKLNVFQVGDDLIIKQRQAVADAALIFDESKLPLHATVGTTGDGELGTIDFLSAKQIADGFNRGVLVIEVGFEMQFHVRPLRDYARRECRSDSEWRPCWSWPRRRQSRNP